MAFRLLRWNKKLFYCL